MTKKKSYAFVFFTAFFIMLIAMLPMIIYNGGIFTYYGDYNSQEIPFYYHVNEELRQNGLFGFDWGTDLGTSLFTAYSFYNTGSVFFYLTLLVPQSAVVYVMPIIMALKTAVAALTSYAFIARFLKKNSACFIGSMLYAFSGAQCYNFFFYHFHDAAAFFPLLLLALEMYVNDGKRGVLTLSVALAAFTNYYFFISEGIFFMIYLLIRCIYKGKGFDITVKKFFGIVFECALGILIAAVLLLPSALAIMDNPRLDETLSGLDYIIYSDKYRIPRIIQSFFMMPDPPARSNIFSPENANWASIAGYLPLFSMIGVIAFLREKRKSFLKTFCLSLFVIALVPILNASFQLFNTAYYARWYFQFSLITALMTAYCFDKSDEVDIKKGVVPTGIITVIFVLVYFIPKNEEDGLKFFDMAEYDMLFILQAAVTLAFFLAAVLLIYFVKKDGVYLRRVAGATALCCSVFLAVNIYYGISQGPYPENYLDATVNADITLPESDTFYRIDTSENTDNFPMFWGYSTMRCFNTNVSTSIMEFYESLGLTRNVASRIETQYTSLRALLSVEYYLEEIDEDDKNDFKEKGFEYIDTQNGFKIYENENYVSMGIFFDTYMSAEDFDKLTTDQKCRILTNAVVLDEENEKIFSGVLSELEKPRTIFNVYNLENTANKLKENACYDFKHDAYGFSAKINTDKGGLVMFSVPFDKGFSATVNGEERQVVKVDNGLCAVFVNEGESEIEFSFFTYGVKPGAVISIIGVLVFIVYMIAVISRRKSKCT